MKNRKVVQWVPVTILSMLLIAFVSLFYLQNERDLKLERERVISQYFRGKEGYTILDVDYGKKDAIIDFVMVYRSPDHIESNLMFVTKVGVGTATVGEGSTLKYRGNPPVKLIKEDTVSVTYLNDFTQKAWEYQIQFAHTGENSVLFRMLSEKEVT